MGKTCENKQFFVVQAEILKKAIEEEKWYLSESERRDVGWEAAEEHFISTISSGFMAGFRVAYCSLICPLKDTCEIARKWNQRHLT